MVTLVGVRDALAAELGHERRTWLVVERVLDVVEDHLAAGLADGLEGLARAAATRGLPLDTGAEELLAHERAASRMVLAREMFEETRACLAELADARRRLAAVEHVLARLRSRPLAERTPAERELVQWLVEELDTTVDGPLLVLDGALAAERERVAGLAVQRTGLTGSAAMLWLAALNAAVVDDVAREHTGGGDGR